MKLQKGQWVKIKNPQVFGEVVGVRQGDVGLPDDDVFYRVQTFTGDYYRGAELEVIPQPESAASRRELFEKFKALSTKLIEGPFDPAVFKEFMETWKALYPDHVR